MPSPAKLRRRQSTALAIVGLASITLAGAHWWREPYIARSVGAAAETTAPAALPVATLIVEPVTSYAVRREYTGEVAAARTSELGFERGGKLVWLGSDRGDLVAAGAVLAKLDARNLDARRQQLVAQRDRAIAQLQELEAGPRQEDIAAAEAAVRDFDDRIALDEIRRDRRQYLAAEGAIAREQFDEVAYRLDSLRDRREEARERLQELYNGTRTEQIAAQAATVRELDAAIADIDVTLDKSILRAPFPGTLSQRHVDEGTVLAAGEGVFRLVEQQRPEVEIGIPVALVNQLPANVRIAIGDRTYTPQLKALLPEVDVATRTRTAIFVLEADPDAVAPGEIARLEVVQTLATEGFWLPTTALVRGNRGLWAAYAVVPDGGAYRVERRDLEAIHTEGDRVLVRGTLRRGDRLVADGTQRLVPGQRVRWQE